MKGSFLKCSENMKTKEKTNQITKRKIQKVFFFLLKCFRFYTMSLTTFQQSYREVHTQISVLEVKSVMGWENYFMKNCLNCKGHCYDHGAVPSPSMLPVFF